MTISYYIYCFCEPPAPEIRRTVGIQDSEIHLIERSGIVVIAGDAAKCPDPSAENVVAHNRVVDSVLRVTTPIPCRFGTLLSPADLACYIDTNKPSVTKLLERLRGCVEMSLRLSHNDGARREDGAGEACSQGEQEIQGRSTRMMSTRGPGAQFLEQKLRRVVRQEIAERQVRATLDWVHSRFGQLPKDRVFRLRPEANPFAEIAHLIDRADLDHYNELARIATTGRGDLRLSTSGPWAPYSFTVIGDGRRGKSLEPSVNLDVEPT